MLASILENANQEKCLQNTVATKCQTFALCHDDDWSVSKVFVNLAAMSWSSQFTRWLWREWGPCPWYPAPVYATDALLDEHESMACSFCRMCLGDARHHLEWTDLIVFLSLIQTSCVAVKKSHHFSHHFLQWGIKIIPDIWEYIVRINSPRLLRYSDTVVMSTTEKPETKKHLISCKTWMPLSKQGLGPHTEQRG